MSTSSTESICPNPTGEISRGVVFFMLRVTERITIVLSIYKPIHSCGASVWTYDHRANVHWEAGWEKHYVSVCRRWNIEKLCQTLQSIEIWFGCSVHTACSVATPEQMMVGKWLHWLGREESVSVEGTSIQLPRPMSESQCNISCPSITSQVVGKMLKCSTFSGNPTKKGEVSFEQ